MTTLTETFSNIADAIRNKNGSSNTYTPAQMPSAINAIPTGGGGTYQSKSVSPTESSQTITPDSGYDALSSVSVGAISSTYVGTGIARKSSSDLIASGATVTVPAGYYESQATKAVAAGSYGAQSQSRNKNTSLGLMQYSVSYPSFSAGYISTAPSSTFNSTLENKTATPSESQQTITPTNNNYYLDSVTVEAIPSSYVGSEVARKSSTDLTTSGATVTAPAGYYAEAASKSVASGSTTGPSSLSGSSATVSTGTNTITLTKTGVSTTPTVSAGYVSSATSSSATVALTANVTTKAAATITPGTTDQTIASGTYLTGTQTISGDSNLIAGNIKSGTSIFGVVGDYSGGGSNPLKFGVLRPDAELIKTFSYDQHIVKDEGVTIPAYATTAQTLKASESLSETITTDLTTYNYYVLIRMLTIPEYNTSAIAKGRFEWIGSSCMYELCNLEGNTIHSLSDPTKYVTGRTSSMISSGTFHRVGYWSTTTTFATYTGASYGCYQTVTTPSFSSNKITLKTPILYMRGSTTYYTQTYWEATTDIRYQWKIEVYRVPKTAELNGEWGLVSQWRHVMDNVYSDSQTLT